MPDLYRRVDIARWSALILLALALLAVAVTEIAGDRIKALQVVVWTACALLMFAAAGAIALPDAESPDGSQLRLATRDETRAAVLRRFAWFGPLVVGSAAAAAAATGQWPMVFGLVLLQAGAQVGDWVRTARWEAAHPGVYQVYVMERFKPRSFLLRADDVPPAGA